MKVIDIREATIRDIPAIRQMAEVAFPDTYKTILSREQIDYMMDMMYSERALQEQMTVQNNIFHMIDGKGYVSYRYDGVRDGRNVFHLEKLYVMPESRGQGLGRQLFESVIASAKQNSNGPVRIELNVNRYNRALAFYEHIGMRRVSQGDFPIGNGYFMNDYIMAIDC